MEIMDNSDLPDCEVCDLLDQFVSGPTEIVVEDNLTDECTPVPDYCDDAPCDGYTGADECCLNNNPCDLDLNDMCDCDSTCAWDAVDCEW